MNYCQVAVKSDAAEESITGVKVSVEDVDRYQTNVASMGPSLAPQEVQPQREADSKGQVTQGQVEQIHTELFLLSYVLAGHEEGEDIARDGCDDDSHVEKLQRHPHGWVDSHVAPWLIGFKG